MDLLKKFFPVSWKYTSDVASLVKGIILYVVAGLIGTLVIWVAAAIVGWLPTLPLLPTILSFTFWALGTGLELYVVGGIVLLILVYTKVIKE